MLDQGFIERENSGTAGLDWRAALGAWPPSPSIRGAGAGSAAADEAVRRIQLPVMKDGKIVGIVDEEDVFVGSVANPDHFNEPVTEAMAGLVTVPGCAGGTAHGIFKHGMVAIGREGQ